LLIHRRRGQVVAGSAAIDGQTTAGAEPGSRDGEGGVRESEGIPPQGADMEASPAERIAVRSPEAILLVDVAEISRVEADGRYTRIHAAGREHLSQHSLAELERMLDGRHFVRVHRSAIVNLQRIRSLRTRDYRDVELLLEDGTAMRLSRTYRPRLESALGLRLGRESREQGS
jgi:two-component system, LytTR family, response regulator